MRLLADENFPAPVVEALAGDGHDIVRVGQAHAGLADVAMSQHSCSTATSRNAGRPG